MVKKLNNDIKESEDYNPFDKAVKQFNVPSDLKTIAINKIKNRLYWYGFGLILAFIFALYYSYQFDKTVIFVSEKKKLKINVNINILLKKRDNIVKPDEDISNMLRDNFYILENKYFKKKDCKISIRPSSKIPVELTEYTSKLFSGFKVNIKSNIEICDIKDEKYIQLCYNKELSDYLYRNNLELWFTQDDYNDKILQRIHGRINLISVRNEKMRHVSVFVYLMTCIPLMLGILFARDMAGELID